MRRWRGCCCALVLLRFARRSVSRQNESPESELAEVPLPEPSANALPLPEDRGAADLEQTLKRLKTTASVLMIVPHPDDEDGALLTYLTRGLGVRATLLTFTRGEGGQNAMSAESYDALGLIRTSELLKADEYYGAQQLWGTEADFGFSKTQEESFAKWGHERVLYDAVLAIRMVRPQVLVSTFVGGPTDGHGQHQVAGEIMQEAFKAAGDPKVFPEQLPGEGGRRRTAAVAASGSLFADAVCAGDERKNVRLRDGEVGAGKVSQLSDRRVDRGLAAGRCNDSSGRHGMRRWDGRMCRLRARDGASRSRSTAEQIRR